MSTPEEDAVRAGTRAGDAAVARFEESGVLVLFVERPRLVNPVPLLEVLRSYAELRRALLAQGYDVPATSLAAAGYTAAEIACFNAAIAAAPPATGSRPAPRIRHSQAEIG